MKTSALGDRSNLLPNGENDTGGSSKHADEWARQLAAMLTAPVSAAPTPKLGAAAPPPTGGNNAASADANPLRHATAGAAVAPQNSDAASDKRLTLTVSTPELGEVSIVIDRAQGGIRVVLGVGGRAAEQQLEPEKAALIQSLRGVGLDVHSVNVVQQTRVGTLLAQPASGKTPTPGAKERDLDEKQEALRKKHKRIDLIG